LTHSPNSPRIETSLAMAYIKAKRYADARKVLEAAVTANSGNADAINALARLLATAPEASVRDGARALKLGQLLFEQARSPELGQTYAMALAESGRYDEASTFPKLKRYFGGEPYFDAIADAHIDLIALAFACDVTRFATLFLGDLSYAGNPLGLPEDNHGGVAHTYDGSPVGTNGNPTSSGTPSTWAALATFNRYAYGKVARMMDKLTAYGIVDSSLIYASSEMGNPALHNTRNVPTVLAGGVNGKFRMGRRLKAPADGPSSNLACKPGDGVFNGTANNHLLVSIARAFGVAVDSFGTQPNAVDRTGSLPGLT